MASRWQWPVVAATLKKAAYEWSATNAGKCCSVAVQSIRQSIAQCDFLKEEFKQVIPVACISGMVIIPLYWIITRTAEPEPDANVHLDLGLEAVEYPTCIWCNATFSDLRDFKRHNVIMHRMYRFCCPRCFNIFLTEVEINHHNPCPIFQMVHEVGGGLNNNVGAKVEKETFIEDYVASLSDFDASFVVQALS